MDKISSIAVLGTFVAKVSARLVYEHVNLIVENQLDIKKQKNANGGLILMKY
ncbi:hypothetical protein [Desulfobacula sp.]|uniref:hypothetical protein n=1 Tax=Desulfobacula sp. TaxID=2593537 RepID=UPI00261F992F|nr:hypothetical protein [Desulfobacula sp.]